jgi:hypothetical protein
MKKAATSIVGALIVFLFVQPLFSQGIQSTIINLPLSGNWRQAADVEKDGSAPGVQVFYDQNTGTILQIRNDYQLRAVNEISQQFRTAGQAAAGPDGAKILMMSMFPLPNKYVQAISGNLHEGHLPKLWEVRDPGNVQWFYVSQLFGGYHVSGGSNSSEIQEQYLPVRVMRAENKSAGRGDALVFEAETEKGAPDAAIKRFKLPASIKDQRLRYGWIQYSPGGVLSSESIISVGFATPVNSGVDVNVVLEQLVKNYGTKAEAKN